MPFLRVILSGFPDEPYRRNNRTMELSIIQRWKLCDLSFIRLVTIAACDRRTDAIAMAIESSAAKLQCSFVLWQNVISHQPQCSAVSTTTRLLQYYCSRHRWTWVSLGHGSPGQWFGLSRVGSGHWSVCQTRYLTGFWVLTWAFIVAFLLQRNTISAN